MKIKKLKHRGGKKRGRGNRGINTKFRQLPVRFSQKYLDEIDART